MGEATKSLAEPFTATPPKPAKASEAAIIGNLITGGLGAGILSLPWAAAGASIITAAVITLLALLVNGWTILIIVQAAEDLQVFDVGGLLAVLPGKFGIRAQAATNAMIWVTTFLLLVGYFIIIADSLTPNIPAGPLQHREVSVVAVSLVILPLCYLSQARLGFTSWLSIAVNVYLFLFIAAIALFGQGEVPAEEGGAGPICLLSFSLGNISMLSGMMMAMGIQCYVLPMYEELEGRSVPKFRRILYISFSFLFVLFVAFQTLAVFAFGTAVDSNVLKNLPPSSASTAAQLGMVVVSAGVYPLMLAPMVSPLRSACRSGGEAVSHAATFAIVITSMMAALQTRSLGLLNMMNGALSLGGAVTLLPGCIGIYLLDANRLAMWVLIIVGSVLSAVGLVYTDNYVDRLQNSCLFFAP